MRKLGNFLGENPRKLEEKNTAAPPSFGVDRYFIYWYTSREVAALYCYDIALLTV